MITRRNLLVQGGNFAVAASLGEALLSKVLPKSGKAYAAVKTYSDINVRSAAGTASPLLATNLISGMPYIGKITEATHTHTYDVTLDQIAQINAGQIVTLTSSRGSDNSGPHTVTINPATLVANGGSIKVFQSENGNLLSVRLGKGDQPFLYVEGTESLDPATVKTCLGVAANCQTESSFTKMDLVTEITDRQIFSSIDRVNVQGETLVHVWATTKSGSVAKIVAKVNK